VEQLNQVPFEVANMLDAGATDSQVLNDLAALMLAVDLVVTVDTATAHLAGALGARTWLMLSTMFDWRWLLNRSDTPWYPTMRLFRQRSRGDWAEVIASISEALQLL